MKTEDIPKWARDRARDLAYSYGDGGSWWASHHAFAAYLATHEQAPADPVLIEARKMLAEDHAHSGVDLVDGGTLYKLGAANDAIMSGRFDLDYRVQNYLRAIRRGMELGA